MAKITDYTIGREGFVTAEDKTEGDFKTPLGTYPLREIWYRPDRIEKPISGLPIHEITEADCWCDDAKHALYNQHFRQPTSPTPASFERLFRDDRAYDIIIVIGYNDAPAAPSKGSAIFIHVEHDDGRPTAGCVALTKEVLLELAKTLGPSSKIEIKKDSINII